MKIKYVGTEELFLGSEAEGDLSKDCKSWTVKFGELPVVTPIADWEVDWLSINYSIDGGCGLYQVPGLELLERLVYDSGPYPMCFVYPMLDGIDTGWFYFYKSSMQYSYKSSMQFDAMAEANLELYPLSKILADWWNNHVGN